MMNWTIGRHIICAGLAIGIVACGQKPAEPAPAAIETAPAPSAQEIPIVEPPAEYQAKTNPLAGSSDAVAAGAVLFKTNCESCHGALGKGDGVASAALTPKPQDLSNAERASRRTDAYVFWRLSEGGSMPPFNSAMTPWKEYFSEEQRWQLVEFIKSLAPVPAPAAKDSAAAPAPETQAVPAVGTAKEEPAKKN